MFSYSTIQIKQDIKIYALTPKITYLGRFSNCVVCQVRKVVTVRGKDSFLMQIWKGHTCVQYCIITLRHSYRSRRLARVKPLADVRPPTVHRAHTHYLVLRFFTTPDPMTNTYRHATGNRQQATDDRPHSPLIIYIGTFLGCRRN